LTLVFPDRNPFLTAVQFADPQAALNHAMELHRLGRLGEAETLYRQLLVHFPDSTDILHLLGLIEVDTNRDAEGFAKLAEAIRRSPQTPHYHANHGVRLLDRRRTGEAETCLREAIRLQPDHPTHHYNLGNALLPQGRHAEAVASFRNSLRLHPENPDAELQLGVALHAGGQRAEARAWYREVLARRPGHFSIATNLGALLQEDCDLDGAAASFRHAIQANPTHPVPLNNLAVIHKELGEAGEAVRRLKQCVELDPASASMHSNLILIMHYDPATTAADLRAEHVRWNERFVPKQLTPHANKAEPRRRLRVGFVSADFRDHVVGRALLPSFRRHEQGNFEIYGYSASPADPFGRAFQEAAAGWREIGGIPPAEVAALIRSDQIDILIDVALHTSDNRLEVFALKPAPVQASWLGYPETSGLATMDYRITDALLEPPGGNLLADAAEQACLLPDCWTCYEPPAGYPEITPPPCLAGQGITFGSLNNTCKINDQVLRAWARILEAVPGSRLRLLAKQGSHRRSIVEKLSGMGVSAERISFFDYVPLTPELSQGALLHRYNEIDVALDTFPYTGMTTTLDALWMGVPVVSLVGERNLGRAGLSLLTNVGMAELAVTDVDAYVAQAIALSREPDRLARLRQELRPRMLTSPLLDAEGFTRRLEGALRDMWVAWCERQGKVA
jgi:predicted O-linked N-acetylglucosamine transferase (SPINDLY family)